MNILTDILPVSEQIPLKLRGIYEKYGYQKYRMGKFEPYDLYRENKNFLKSKSIITFTNANGRLMALKPDVTISIVKNTKDETTSQKLYYNENVFRMEYGSHEYSEISQMGIEYIGGDVGYAEAEVVTLAIKSLAAIGSSFRLNFNHMGYITALLDSIFLLSEAKEQILKAIKHKSLHDIVMIARSFSIDEDRIAALYDVAGISCDFKTALAIMQKYVFNEDMQKAIDELRELNKTLEKSGHYDKIQLDFSIINDIDYYNGIVFQGYIEGAPRPIMSGGRYDNLMLRFNKPKPAIGFALYLGELDRAFYETKTYDVDVLLVYGESKPTIVADEVEKLIAKGYSVRAEEKKDDTIRAKRIILLDKNEIRELL